MRRAERRAAQTRAWVEVVVRSGLLAPETVVDRVAEAISSDLRGLAPRETALAWVAEARAAWERDAAHWSVPTDHDRLLRAFAALEGAGFVVLAGCADHWAAQEALAGRTLRGLLWFTPTDVWHAVDAGMLEVNLWHPGAANAADGDDLLEEVLGALAEQSLPARFDEGRIEIAMFWRRRP